jgi:predicted RNase H-like HicB family nuclease
VLTDYIQAAMRRAKYEILPEDHTYYGEIPGFQGVWSNADTLEGCRAELQEVLEDWLMFRISRHLSLPVVDGIELRIEAVA